MNKVGRLQFIAIPEVVVVVQHHKVNAYDDFNRDLADHSAMNGQEPAALLTC